MPATASSATDLGLASEQQCNRSNRKDNADHGKRVAEAQDESLTMDGRADHSDRLALRDSQIGHAVRHEILCQMVDPVAHFVPVDVTDWPMMFE